MCKANACPMLADVTALKGGSMFKQIILNWLNRFWDRAEDDYRNANICGVLENEDKALMKEFRAKMKYLNQKFGGYFR